MCRAGGNCGSSHLNRNFERLITDRLRGEYYLFEKGLTIDDFIQPIMQDFETKRKRQLDTTSRACRFSIMVKDLRENPEKGFENNWMTISRYVN
jgi:hypothetical protein